ncbi:MAG TPA: hybrid sensor histidine kinase/response regulator [archaeon]|nr:hybrid sensor histidine kinase/response regulator [archaeon]
MREEQVTRYQTPRDLSAPTTEPSPARILVVDDEEALWTSLVTAFSLEGYRAAGVGSAREALQHLRQAPCDVLLVDLRMPDMDGIQLMERVRESAPDLLVILMTGVATVESAVRALKGGAYDYILKPFTLTEIFHTVKRGLEQQRLKQENVQLTELNRRLQELDQIKSNLLSAITHEFRTPLTVMSGWLDLLLGDHFGPLATKQRESLAAIRSGIIRLGRLISNLLVFVETDRSQLSGSRIPLSLASVFQALAAELAPECQERRVRLRVESAPDLPQFSGDGERLRLLFFNLVENAIKFNEPGGEVAIQAGKDGNSLLISITNTRGEIPGERIPGLLEPFTQGDMSASRVAGGLGMGLAVVRLITEAHNGKLVIESGQGRGTTVRVRLPLGS